MKTALVTGASGYLGGHVARRLLAEGWNVVALTRPSSRLAPDLDHQVVRADYDGTLASAAAALAKAPIDVIVHLASAVVAVHTADQTDALIDANVRLPAHLLEAARHGTCKRFVNTGTFWQHCNSDAYEPVNLYAATKQALEDLARAYVVNDGICFTTLVLFDTYGADDPRPKIVRLLVDAVGAADPLLLSPGEQVLDLTHAKDVAGAFLVACERIVRADLGGWERFRVTGDRLTLKQLVDVVQGVAGTRPHVQLGARSYRTREIMVPADHNLEILPGWASEHALAGTVAEMLGRSTLAIPAA